MSRAFEARLGKFGRNEQIRHTARGNSYSYLSVKSLLADNCILKEKNLVAKIKKEMRC
jgi:hypothetical protein